MADKTWRRNIISHSWQALVVGGGGGGSSKPSPVDATYTAVNYSSNSSNSSIELTFKRNSCRKNSTQFASAANLLVSASHAGALKVWTLPSGECIATLVGHTLPVTALVEVSSDSQDSKSKNNGQPLLLLASASADRTVRLWDMQRLECVRTLSDHSARITSLVRLGGDDRTLLATGSCDSTVKIWHLDDGAVETISETRTRIQDLLGLVVVDEVLALERVGYDMLASACRSGKIELFNWRTTQIVRTLAPPAATKTTTKQQQQEIHPFCLKRLSGGGDDVLATSSNGSADITIWRNYRSWWKLKVKRSRLEGHAGSRVTALCEVRSLGRRWLASGCADGTVKAWQVESGGECVRTLNEQSAITAAAVDSLVGVEDDRLASAHSDGSIRIWSLDEAKCVRTMLDESFKEEAVDAAATAIGAMAVLALKLSDNT